MAKYPYEYASLCFFDFFGIMAAAKVGCRSSCTRSKSQADKEKVTRAENPTWTNLQYILCRRDDVANWHPGLVVAETWKHLKTYAALRCFEYMLAHWPVCDLLFKHHRAMVLPAWSVVMCPKIRRKTPKLIMPFHRLWPKHYIENHRNARKKTSQIECVLLHDNMCNIPTIPMIFAATNSSRNQHFFVSLSSCKTSVMSLWISAMFDNLAMDPPAISCHEDQFPHVVKQINTTRKWHFFHLTNATIGHQCLGFHTLRTWPKSFPQLRWVQDFWFAHDKIWNHHVKSCQACFFENCMLKTQKSCWHCSYLYSKSYPKTVDRFGRDMSNMFSTMIIPFWLPKYKPRFCFWYRMQVFVSHVGNRKKLSKLWETQPILCC